MKTSAIVVVLLLAGARAAGAQADIRMPTMRVVEPESARAGEVVVVQGANLGPEYVAALYLTDGKTDTKVTIVEQTATAIRFRIPPEVKPGRPALMVLTTGREPKFIEEPVKITVEPGNTTSRLDEGSAGKVALCLTVWTNKYGMTMLSKLPAKSES